MANIFLGKTLFDCKEALIEKLKENYAQKPFMHHIFIVPDRVSVLTEIDIFDKLQIESCCNIDVLTMSRLAGKMLKNIKILSKSTSCMILQKLIKQNQSKLKCFNKNIDSDLATVLFETISQFKSCKIDFKDVKISTENKILSDKLEDIALLYEEYEKYLKAKGLFDTMDKLDFLLESIEGNEYIKNSFVYVSDFDDFTFQGFQFLSTLIKNSFEFNIGVASSENPSNEHIYNKDFFEKLKKIFDKFKIIPNILECKATTKFLNLQDNLFSFSPICKEMSQNNLELFEGKNLREEVLFVASQIKEFLFSKKYKFGDIVVACPNLKDCSCEIEKIFRDFGFNFFVDLSEDFESSCVVNFLTSFVDLLQENFSRQSILSFVKSAFFGENDFSKIENFEDYLIKYNIDNYYDFKNSNVSTSLLLKDFEEVRNKLLGKTILLCQKLRNEETNTYRDFVELFKKLIVDFEVEKKINDFVKEFVKKGDLVNAKYFEQYYDVLCQLFDNIQDTLGEEKCSLNLFFKTFLSGVKATNISVAPMLVNSIFVGDTSKSFFGRGKVLFVINALEDNFPFVLNDCGIVSDKEIEELSERYKLEPSVAQINFKERFKAFELLLTPTEKLFLSYNYQKASSQKSKILDDISKMCLVRTPSNGFMPIPFKTFDGLSFEQKNNNFSTVKGNFVSLYRGFLDGQKENQEDVFRLCEILGYKDEELKDFNYENKLYIKEDIFFLQDKTSASQIECFMTCPFLHFARYGLKLQEKEKGELDPINIGRVIHEVAQNLIRDFSLPLEDAKLKIIAGKIFDEVVKKEIFESILLNPSNKILIENLKQEVVRFCEGLNYQAKNSLFKPIMVESRFDDFGKIKSIKIKVKNRLIKLVGQIDRIDVFEDYFRIIDYKTGSCDTSLKELFFGKKIQLEAYLYVAESSLKLRPAGAYYFPIKSGFAKSRDKSFEKFRLKGDTVQEENVIFASDKRLKDDEFLSSDIVEIKYNQNKSGKTLYRYSKLASSEKILNKSLYAVRLIEQACKDICKLNITPCPIDLDGDPCSMCKFFGLCRFDENFKNVKRKPKATTVSKTFESRKEDDLNGEV